MLDYLLLVEAKPHPPISAVEYCHRKPLDTKLFDSRPVTRGVR